MCFSDSAMKGWKMGKLSFWKVAAAFGCMLSVVSAQDDVIISTPSPWVTLRNDSISLTVQADTSKLPQNRIAFRVRRHRGSRITTLFSKRVKMDDISGEFFLGKVRNEPLGGSDLLSVKWSVPGTDLEGVVGPLGIVDLKSESQKGMVSAVCLKEGASMGEVEKKLSAADGFEVGGSECAVGWSKDGLFVMIKEGTEAQIQFAFDGKCGRNAFLSWADRFVVYNPESDSVKGVHYKRSFDDKAIKYTDMSWGEEMSYHKTDSGRIVRIPWHEIGVLPFEERNVGFSAYQGKTERVRASFPASARREIPGTWGSIRLEK